MNGEILHVNDMHQVVESYIQLALLQYDILSHFPRSLQTGPNAFYKYVANLFSCDVNEVFVQLSNFKDWLQHYTRIQSHISVRAAKKTLSLRGVNLKHCVFDLIRPIIWVYVKYNLPNLHTQRSTERDALVFRYLYDFCCLISRLTLNHVDSITDTAIQKYCDQEEAMKNWQYDDYLVNELRFDLVQVYVNRPWFPDEYPNYCLHGSFCLFDEANIQPFHRNCSPRNVKKC